jgi:hypothetical protein
VAYTAWVLFWFWNCQKVRQTPHVSHSQPHPTKSSFICRIKMPYKESGENTRDSLDVHRMLFQSANSRLFQMFENMGSNASGVENLKR